MAEAWKQWQGQTVNGEFLLGEYMGGSQNGAVFQTQFGDRDPKPAAIKLISENSSNAKNRLASWQSASTFSHPNLIKIFQAGHCRIGDAKLLYVVMEYADENLSQILPHRPLTEIEASEMLSPVLGALAYLHAKGLVHSRIKPANIMASGDQLKLSSDGIRRAGDPISEPSGYDPPEATSSSAGDIWSLGMTLVEVLTQRLPAWERHAQADPNVPKTLPAPLLDIARHCLRRDPARRWTLADIAKRLNPPLAAQRAEQSAQQSAAPRNIWYLIAALIVLLASIGLVSRRLLKESPRSDTPIPQATENISKKSSPEPRPVVSAAPAEKKPEPPVASPGPAEKKSEPPIEKPVANAPPQIAVPTPPAQAPKVPEPKAASSGVLHQVLPDVPQKSLDTIRGTVRVGIKVSVDPSGKVTDATIDSPGPSTYFANLALDAAQKWKFAPSRSGPSDWTLRFEFTPDGTQAFAEHSAP
ncbi:MAG: TonB family protein [Candidatus Acidiferrales bacterium]